ncbi:MAG: tetraacyldisaccharide 4'-kinase [Phycisphaerales bacterium]|nr:tetraacyldisaccharide 4'-kinase [Planctomycetota bacterium]MCH8507209.1 tetraacyldisaccharide 4'-kinase [Phycisphaerales bacterium]
MTSGKPDRSPTPLPGFVTGPLSRLYGMELARRNRRWDRGEGVTRLDRPVVSIGNLSAGGTGKTPMVRWAVGVLRSMGHQPAVAMRGYKARKAGMSDEEREHREAMPGVPVVAQPDRAAGLRALFQTEAGRSVDCVVLDDGFQHRRLAREVDIVLVDASRPPDRDALLPRGFLREPPASLARAHAAVITHAEMVDPDEADRLAGMLRSWLPPGAPVAVAEHRWTGLSLPESPGEVLDVGWLDGREVVIACAIGHPEAFLAGLGRAGIAPGSVAMVLPDHDPFGPGRIRSIRRVIKGRRPEALVVTAKDWAKLSGHAGGGGVGGWGCPVVVPRLEMAWRSGEAEVAMLLRDPLGPAPASS